MQRKGGEGSAAAAHTTRNSSTHEAQQQHTQSATAACPNALDGWGMSFPVHTVLCLCVGAGKSMTWLTSTGLPGLHDASMLGSTRKRDVHVRTRPWTKAPRGRFTSLGTHTRGTHARALSLQVAAAADEAEAALSAAAALVSELPHLLSGTTDPSAWLDQLREAAPALELPGREPQLLGAAVRGMAHLCVLPVCSGGGRGGDGEAGGAGGAGGADGAAGAGGGGRRGGEAARGAARALLGLLAHRSPAVQMTTLALLEQVWARACVGVGVDVWVRGPRLFNTFGDVWLMCFASHG
eukprot:365056-Chlamydomonas_euryale.AAC.2